MHTHTHTNKQTLTTQMHTHTHTQTNKYKHTHTHLYTTTHKCTHVHTHTNKQIHTHTHRDSHFLRIETGVCPLVGMITPLELGQRACSADGHVIGVEGRVNDKLAVIDQVRVVDRCTAQAQTCLLYTSPSPRDILVSRMPSSA